MWKLAAIQSVIGALAMAALAQPAHAVDVIADAVTENFAPPLHSSSACPADVTVLSDGTIVRFGYCILTSTPANYTVTFDFSPSANERTTGLRVWSNAGSAYGDAELRVFDVEVDYVDDNGAPQTLVLDDVDIGDTVNVNDDKFVSFTSVDPLGLRQATQIRISDLRARPGDARLEFREINAVVQTPPDVVLSGTSTGNGDPFVVTATFTEDVTGAELSDFAVTNATTSNYVQVAPNVYQFTVTPTVTSGTSTIEISLPANSVTDLDEGLPNPTSGTLSLNVVAAAPPPGGPSVIIDQTIRREELKTLRQSLDRAQGMSRDARDRLARAIRCREIDEDETATVEDLEDCDRYLDDLNTDFETDGFIEVADGAAQITGTLSQKQANADGTRRRLFFGEFDVLDDSELGVIATLSGRVAWERLVGDDRLWGYFLGAEASLSDVRGQYSGDRQRLGFSGGLYGARAFQNGLTADGFAVLGYGLNTLDLSDGVIDIDADYRAPSVLLGGAVSGERAYENFVLHPELALAVGYTDIGTVDFDAGAGAETTDPGHVALARLTFAPEIRVPWDVTLDMYDSGSFDITPRLICEWVDAGSSDNDCGVGLELELSALSESGLHELSGRIAVEEVGGASRSIFSISVDSRF